MIAFEKLKLKASPNQYLVAPEGFCPQASPHRKAPVFKVSAANLREAFVAVALAEPRVTRGASDTGLDQHDFIQRSALLGFADDVTVRFIALSPATSTLAIYSRSRMGWSDMGVNRKRIDLWLAKVAAKLA